jgi:hypothetical protein
MLHDVGNLYFFLDNYRRFLAILIDGNGVFWARNAYLQGLTKASIVSAAAL